MELNVEDNIVLDIRRLGINGEGIGFYNKLAVFVDGAIPGEKVKIKITSRTEKMAKGEIIEFRNVSPNRVEPKCQYYEKCGGCQISHIDYKYTGVLKRELIIESLQRYTDINYRAFEIKPTIIMDNPNGYRYKSSLPVRKFNEKSTLGLYEPETNKIIYIDNCLVQNERVNKINAKVLEFIDELNVTPYVEKFRRGEIKYIITRVSHYNNEAQVTLVTHDKTPKIFDLARKIIEIENVVSVYESINDGIKEGVFFGPDLNLLEGKPTIIESIGIYKYELLPNAFFQLNPVQTERLYEEVRKACKLSRTETVLDAYCGVGTIGLYLSKLAKEIIGIEYNKEAVENANQNAKLNKVRNATFYQGDVVELLPKLLEEGLKLDVIVVDPPRTGLGSELIETIKKTDVKRIVYVSCNPATLAKDLNILTEKYDVKYMQPVDMFPQTAHVECVVLLELNKQK